MQARLKTTYQEDIANKLAEDFAIKNVNAIPKVTKVVVNMGVGDAIKNKELMENLKKDLATITGQQPSVREAKVSVASFSLRRGMPVGLKVTLRGERMYSFLDKLFTIVLPRLRDFRGISLKSFDKSGNYTLGLAEHTVFPEIDMTKSAAHGLEVCIVTNAREPEKARKLLEYLGMPFEKES